MTFQEFCREFDATREEAKKLAWYLCAIRMQELMKVLMIGLPKK